MKRGGGNVALYTQQNYYFSYSEVALYLRSTSKPNFVVPISRVKNPCATHEEVPMGYQQLLVCREGNKGITLVAQYHDYRVSML